MKVYIVVLATLLIFGMFVQAVPEHSRDIKGAKLEMSGGKRYVRALLGNIGERGSGGATGKIEEMRKLAEKRFARDATGQRKFMERMHRSVEEY